MIELKGFEKVEQFPTEVPSAPVISICVQTYNHKNYIISCLDGLLSQKTDHCYEILLSEDESCDGTRKICIEYAKKYPEKIRLFLHTRDNVIYINGSPTGRFNFIYNLINARGDYIAICDGDDIWSDPYKLQKQVDFLENNRDYGLVYGNCRVWYEKNDRLIKDRNEVFGIIPHSGWVYDKILEKAFYPTLTVLFRAELLSDFWESKDSNIFLTSSVGDFVLWTSFARKTKFQYLDEIFGIYRNRIESIIHSRDVKKTKLLHESVYKVLQYFISEYGSTPQIARQVDINYHNIMMTLYFQMRNKEMVKFHFDNLNNRKLKHYLLYFGVSKTLAWRLLLKTSSFLKEVMYFRNINRARF